MGGAGCCDNKAFGEPCGDCAFDVPHRRVDSVAAKTADSAAEKALAWGMLTAQSDPGASRFWQAAIAADLYRRQEFRELDPIVDATASIASSRASRLGASFMVAQADPPVPPKKPDEPEEPPKEPDKPAPDEPIEHRDPPIDSGEGGGPMCCVEKFAYPGLHWNLPPQTGAEGWAFSSYFSKPGGTIPHGTKVTAGQLGFHFDVEGIFSDVGACDCSCCLFVQVVLGHRLLMRMAHRPAARWTERTDPPHQDCQYEIGYVDTAGEQHEVAVFAGPDWKPPSDAELKEMGIEKIVILNGPFCAGSRSRRDPHGALPVLLGDPNAPPYFGDCYLYFVDEPKQPVPAGREVEWQIDFMGLILDTCNNDEIKAIEGFGRTEAGTLNSTATEWTPDGQPSWYYY